MALRRHHHACAWLLAVVAVAGCSQPEASPDAGGGPRGTRVVLITLDTLRYDSLVPRAGGTTSMPRLSARVAASGTRFDHFFSATSRTQPSHASMFTGLHPWNHGVYRNGLLLGDELDTVAERLRSAHFETAAVVASFPVSRRFGFAQGYDRFLDEFDVGKNKQQWHDVALGENRFYSLAGPVTDRALELLDGFETPRQHLWVHYFDPHAPYGDASEGGGIVRLPQLVRRLQQGQRLDARQLERARRLYDRDVEALDAALDRLLTRLAQDGAEFATHVVIAADHGESFGEHGSLGHGYRLTPEQIRVPLAILSPEVETGLRSDPAGSADVAATLLALAGLPEVALEGRDLRSRPASAARPVVGMRDYQSEIEMEQRLGGEVPVEGNLFYIAAGDGRLSVGSETGIEANYLVDADVEGAGDPSGEPAADADAEARDLFAGFARRIEVEKAAQELSPEVLEGLRALGYAQ